MRPSSGQRQLAAAPLFFFSQHQKRYRRPYFDHALTFSEANSASQGLKSPVSLLCGKMSFGRYNLTGKTHAYF